MWYTMLEYFLILVYTIQTQLLHLYSSQIMFGKINFGGNKPHVLVSYLPRFYETDVVPQHYAVPVILLRRRPGDE